MNRISIRIHEDSVSRHADLIQLEQIANGYPSRERFLTELTLDPPDATSDQAGVPLLDEDYLILSTIHSAKGQEWKSVFVLNVVDGCIPSDLGTGTSAEIEEEAASALCRHDARQGRSSPDCGRSASSPMARMRKATGTSMPLERRFIPNGLLGLFERTVMADNGARIGRTASEREACRVDVGARMRGMWR